MITPTNQYRPDYAVPPGWILAERLEAQGISQAEFARRCGRSTKLISDIIAGNAPIEPKTALQFEKVLGMDASVWLGMEADYHLHQARSAEAQRAKALAPWAENFPVNELAKRGIMQKPASDADTVAFLLTFFGVASVEAWQARQKTTQLAYHHSPSFKSNEFTLATWLRIGEIRASQTECLDYNPAIFERSLKEIRRLTTADFNKAIDQAVRLCSDAGVALVIVKPLPNTALSGASWWLTPRKAVIQLSARRMSDDHIWFSLFHEAAHIILHSKKSVFVHENNHANTDIETQANDWAARFLIPTRSWNDFINTSAFTQRAILKFANEQAIAPGIIVGRLQYEKRLPWNTQLNDLKVRLDWKE